MRLKIGGCQHRPALWRFRCLLTSVNTPATRDHSAEKTPRYRRHNQTLHPSRRDPIWRQRQRQLPTTFHMPKITVQLSRGLLKLPNNGVVHLVTLSTAKRRISSPTTKQ